MNNYIDIDKEKAIKDFANIIELPIVGKALYYRMLELKDTISANIENFNNILNLREMVRKKTKNWPRKSNSVNFEIVKISDKLWIPTIPYKKSCEISKVFPRKLVDYIVEKAVVMDSGIIERISNLVVPGIKGKTFDLWFEKIREDFICGIIKGIDFANSEELSYNVDIEGMIERLDEIDFDELLIVVKHIIESQDFRKAIVSEYRKIWKNILETGNI
jgi:hypothetical protein